MRMPEFQQQDFQALSDGDFFMLGTGLLWQRIGCDTARVLSTTGDADLDSATHEMPACTVGFVPLEDVQEIADALGISVHRVMPVQTGGRRRVITEKCPPLDTPLMEIPRFPKRVPEALAGKDGRKGAWDGVTPEQVTLRWFLSLPFDAIYHDTAPAYMKNNATNGRVMVTKFLEEWGIDTALMGPSYPFDMHSVAPALPLPPQPTAEPGVIEYGAQYRAEEALPWETPLVDFLDDGDTTWSSMLVLWAKELGRAPEAILLADAALLTWEELCGKSADVAEAVYRRCLAVTGKQEVAWPALVPLAQGETEEGGERDETEEGKLDYAHFCSTHLRESGCLPDTVTYPDGSVLSTETWTGASLAGWTVEDVAALFQDIQQAAAFLGWLDKFDWQTPVQPESSTDGSFALALEAVVRDLEPTQQKSVLDIADVFAGLEPAQRRSLLQVLSMLTAEE